MNRDKRAQGEYMAGFCRNCGTAFGDGEAFCKKCGTPVTGAPTRAAAASPAAPAPVAAGVPVTRVAAPVAVGVPAASTPSKGSSPLVKILLVVVIVFFLCGAIGIASLVYIGYRVKQKANELGLHVPSRQESTEQAAELRSLDGCSLLSKADVSAAVGMTVVRAEPISGDTPGCTYSVMGDSADMTAKHVGQMHKGEMNKQQQDMVEGFGRSIFQNAESAPGASPSEHPGEAPVLSFSIDTNNADFQMKLNRATLGRLGPGTVTVANLGDDAFDAYGAMLMIRKGDKLIRVMYMMCPCVTNDVVPLMKNVVAKL
jgi:hypothetical protein